MEVKRIFPVYFQSQKIIFLFQSGLETINLTDIFPSTSSKAVDRIASAAASNSGSELVYGTPPGSVERQATSLEEAAAAADSSDNETQAENYEEAIDNFVSEMGSFFHSPPSCTELFFPLGGINELVISAKIGRILIGKLSPQHTLDNCFYLDLLDLHLVVEDFWAMSESLSSSTEYSRSVGDIRLTGSNGQLELRRDEECIVVSSKNQLIALFSKLRVLIPIAAAFTLFQTQLTKHFTRKIIAKGSEFVKCFFDNCDEILLSKLAKSLGGPNEKCVYHFLSGNFDVLKLLCSVNIMFDKYE